MEISNMKMKDSEGKEVTYRIQEIENGYMITCNKEWKEGDEYMHDSKTYYSETNPFAEESDNMYDIMKSIAGEK